MLLSKSVDDKSSKFKKAISFLNPLNLKKSKTVDSEQAREAIEAKKMLLEEFSDVALPQGAIVDLHIAEAGSAAAPVSEKTPEGKADHKELPKDIHRAEIRNLDESRAAANLKENINKLLSENTDSYQQVIESDLIPAMVEDLGMGVLSVVNVDSVYSKWSEKNKLENTLRVLDKLIQNKEPESQEKPMSRSMTVHVREYGKKVEKTDNTAVYEKMRTQLLKQKFVSSFSPDVKKIIVENLLPELIEEGFTEDELFALEKEEIKYHFYQTLVDLVKHNEIKVRQEKIELAQYALLSKFQPGKVPFGQK